MAIAARSVAEKLNELPEIKTRAAIGPEVKTEKLLPVIGV